MRIAHEAITTEIMKAGCHAQIDEQQDAGVSKQKTEEKQDTTTELSQCGHEAPERVARGDAEILHALADLAPHFRPTGDFWVAVCNEGQAKPNTQDQQANVTIAIEKCQQNKRCRSLHDVKTLMQHLLADLGGRVAVRVWILRVEQIFDNEKGYIAAWAGCGRGMGIFPMHQGKRWQGFDGMGKMRMRQRRSRLLARFSVLLLAPCFSRRVNKTT